MTMEETTSTPPTPPTQMKHTLPPRLRQAALAEYFYLRDDAYRIQCELNEWQHGYLDEVNSAYTRMTEAIKGGPGEPIDQIMQAYSRDEGTSERLLLRVDRTSLMLAVFLIGAAAATLFPSTVWPITNVLLLLFYVALLATEVLLRQRLKGKRDRLQQQVRDRYAKLFPDAVATEVLDLNEVRVEVDRQGVAHVNVGLNHPMTLLHEVEGRLERLTAQVRDFEQRHPDLTAGPTGASAPAGKGEEVHGDTTPSAQRGAIRADGDLGGAGGTGSAGGERPVNG